MACLPFAASPACRPCGALRPSGGAGGAAVYPPAVTALAPLSLPLPPLLVLRTKLRRGTVTLHCQQQCPARTWGGRSRCLAGTCRYRACSPLLAHGHYQSAAPQARRSSFICAHPSSNSHGRAASRCTSGTPPSHSRRLHAAGQRRHPRSGPGGAPVLHAVDRQHRRTRRRRRRRCFAGASGTRSASCCGAPGQPAPHCQPGACSSSSQLAATGNPGDAASGGSSRFLGCRRRHAAAQCGTCHRAVNLSGRQCREPAPIGPAARPWPCSSCGSWGRRGHASSRRAATPAACAGAACASSCGGGSRQGGSGQACATC